MFCLQSFLIFIEVLLRHINKHANELGVELSAENAKRAGVTNLPPALKLLALAYADDVFLGVLICPSFDAAQEALQFVQEWAMDFGMTVGVGQDKSMAMLVSAATVIQACENDVNGMPKRAGSVRVSTRAIEEDTMNDPTRTGDVQTDDDPDDEEWSFGDDPTIEVPQPTKQPRPPCAKARPTM